MILHPFFYVTVLLDYPNRVFRFFIFFWGVFILLSKLTSASGESLDIYITIQDGISNHYIKDLENEKLIIFRHPNGVNDYTEKYEAELDDTTGSWNVSIECFNYAIDKISIAVYGKNPNRPIFLEYFSKIEDNKLNFKRYKVQIKATPIEYRAYKSSRKWFSRKKLKKLRKKLNWKTTINGKLEITFWEKHDDWYIALWQGQETNNITFPNSEQLSGDLSESEDDDQLKKIWITSKEVPLSSDLFEPNDYEYSFNFPYREPFTILKFRLILEKGDRNEN